MLTVKYRSRFKLKHQCKNEDRYYLQYKYRGNEGIRPFEIIKQNWFGVYMNQAKETVVLDLSLNIQVILQRFKKLNITVKELEYNWNQCYDDLRGKPHVQFNMHNTATIDVRLLLSICNWFLCYCSKKEIPTDVFCLYCSKGAHTACAKENNWRNERIPKKCAQCLGKVNKIQIYQQIKSRNNNI